RWFGPQRCNGYADRRPAHGCVTMRTGSPRFERRRNPRPGSGHGLRVPGKRAITERAHRGGVRTTLLVKLVVAVANLPVFPFETSHLSKFRSAKAILLWTRRGDLLMSRAPTFSQWVARWPVL